MGTEVVGALRLFAIYDLWWFHGKRRCCEALSFGCIIMTFMLWHGTLAGGGLKEQWWLHRDHQRRNDFSQPSSMAVILWIYCTLQYISCEHLKLPEPSKLHWLKGNPKRPALSQATYTSMLHIHCIFNWTSHTVWTENTIPTHLSYCLRDTELCCPLLYLYMSENKLFSQCIS